MLVKTLDGDDADDKIDGERPDKDGELKESGSIEIELICREIVQLPSGFNCFKMERERDMDKGHKKHMKRVIDWSSVQWNQITIQSKEWEGHEELEVILERVSFSSFFFPIFSSFFR